MSTALLLTILVAAFLVVRSVLRARRKKLLAALEKKHLAEYLATRHIPVDESYKEALAEHEDWIRFPPSSVAEGMYGKGTAAAMGLCLPSDESEAGWN